MCEDQTSANRNDVDGGILGLLRGLAAPWLPCTHRGGCRRARRQLGGVGSLGDAGKVVDCARARKREREGRQAQQPGCVDSCSGARAWWRSACCEAFSGQRERPRLSADVRVVCEW